MESTLYEIKETHWPAKTLIIKREIVAFDKLSDFFARNYGGLYNGLAQKGLSPISSPMAIYYSIDEAGGKTDVAAAVQVAEGTPVIEGYELVFLPATKVLTILYTGPYEKMKLAYDSMEKYLAEHGLKRTMMIEQYLSDPETEKDPNQWRTNIFMLVE